VANGLFFLRSVDGKISANIPPEICVGSTFDVTIKINKGTTRPIDGISVNLKFDPTKLKVNSITNSGVFDDVIKSTYDNAAGTVSYIAGVWDNPAPTATSDLFTIRFTALGTTAASTVLSILNSSTLTSGGVAVPYSTGDATLNFAQCLKYKVGLQRALPAPNASWKTPLTISVGSATAAKTYTVTTNESGEGTLSLDSPLAAGDYFCVKNSHTLANKILQPFGSVIDFGTLLEGDATNNNIIDLIDYSFVTNHKGCQGTASYDTQADFNADGCVTKADASILKANLGQSSGCTWNSSLQMYRNSKREGNQLSFGISSIPASLKIGDSFDITIYVNASESQSTDVAGVHPNFDPAKLSVSKLTAGSAFDFVLQSDFDNTKGEINFAAGVWDNPMPKQTEALVTVTFTVLQADSIQQLDFRTRSHETVIASAGTSVTATTQDGIPVVVSQEKGNVDGEGDVNLADAITVLKVLAGLNPPKVIVGADVNGDNKIGLEEVIYILQKVAGLR